MSDVLPLARSPIAPAPPVSVTDGWEVSARRSSAELTITDCTPLTKIQVRAPIDGQAAAALGVRFGRAARKEHAGRGLRAGEWLLLAGPGAELDPERITAPDPSASWVDLTHGRSLIRLNGKSAPDSARQGLRCRPERHDHPGWRRVPDLGRRGGHRRDPRRPGRCRRGHPSYLLHCERSSGQYLFDALLRAGAEFGIEIDGFRMPDALPSRPDPENQ